MESQTLLNVRLYSDSYSVCFKWRWLMEMQNNTLNCSKIVLEVLDSNFSRVCKIERTDDGFIPEHLKKIDPFYLNGWSFKEFFWNFNCILYKKTLFHIIFTNNNIKKKMFYWNVSMTSIRILFIFSVVATKKNEVIYINCARTDYTVYKCHLFTFFLW